MTIGLLTVKLHIPHSSSLKDKRQVIKSLKDRLHNRFNVSVAEVDDHEKWQLAAIAIACVNNDKQNVDSMLNNILNFIDNVKEAYISDHKLQLF